jgi:hypothetical protein
MFWFGKESNATQLLKETLDTWRFATRQEMGSLAAKKMHSGMFAWKIHGKSWEIYRKTIGHYAADGESMYETEATEQTANTTSRVRILDSRSILLQHSLSSGGHDVDRPRSTGQRRPSLFEIAVQVNS